MINTIEEQTEIGPRNMYDPAERWSLEFITKIEDISQRPGNVKLLLVSDQEADRLRACKFIKKVIEEKLRTDKDGGKIRQYKVPLIDLCKTPLRQSYLQGPYSDDKKNMDFWQIWRIAGNQNGSVVVPIFHNADKYPELPQHIFDTIRVPGILSYSRQGYLSINNISKRECYIDLKAGDDKLTTY